MINWFHSDTFCYRSFCFEASSQSITISIFKTSQWCCITAAIVHSEHLPHLYVSLLQNLLDVFLNENNCFYDSYIFTIARLDDISIFLHSTIERQDDGFLDSKLLPHGITWLVDPEFIELSDTVQNLCKKETLSMTNDFKLWDWLEAKEIKYSYNYARISFLYAHDWRLQPEVIKSVFRFQNICIHTRLSYTLTLEM